jgi:hypothetical protein
MFCFVNLEFLLTGLTRNGRGHVFGGVDEILSLNGDGVERHARA